MIRLRLDPPTRCTVDRYIVTPYRQDWRDAWRGHNRLTQRADEDYALLAPEDLGDWVGRDGQRELDRGWGTSFTADPWTVSHLLGYDGQLLAESADYREQCIRLANDHDWEAKLA